MAFARLVLFAALLQRWQLTSAQCTVTAGTSEDAEVVSTARGTVNEWCGAVKDFTSDDRESAREALERGSEADHIIEILDTSEDSDEMGEKFQESFSDGTAIGKAVGNIVFAFLFLVIMLLCCWNCYPCCRCCKREKRYSKGVMLGVKVIIGLLMSAFFLGTLVYLMATMNNAQDFKAGMDHMACSSGELGIAFLDGNGNDWQGLSNVADFMVDMSAKVESGSQFMTDLEAILLDTTEIDSALAATTATLSLLSSTMSLNANLYPKAAVGVDAYHECYMCSTTAGVVDPVISDIEDGAAQAIADARAEVEQQLQGEELDELRDLMCDTAGTVVDAKNEMRDALEKIIDFDTGSFEAVVPAWMVVGIIAFIAVLGVCIGTICFMVKEPHSMGQRQAGEGYSGANPYSRVPGRCTCFCWWTGCWTGIVIMFLAGILIVISVPVTSLCVVLADLTGDQVDRWGNVLLDVENNTEWSNAATVVKTCLLDGDGDLLATLEVDNVTLKNKLSDDINSAISAAFDELNAAPTEPIASSQSYLDLKAAFATPVDKMTALDTDTYSAFWAESAYSGLSTQSSLVALAQQTSMDCDDDASGFSGITTFVDACGTEFGTTTTPCTSGLTEPTLGCSSLSGQARTECDAAQAVLTLKYNIMSSGSFRCDVFEDDAGLPCDILGMTADGSGGYLNDCARADGTYVTKEVTCTWAEFVTYVTEYGQTNGRLDKVINRLDGATTATRSRIEDDLQTLVDDELLTPVDSFVNQSMCTFTQDAYDDFIDGACYKTVASFRRIGEAYVGMAWFTVLTAAVSWFMFRWSSDNHDVWQREAASAPATPPVQGELL